LCLCTFKDHRMNQYQKIIFSVYMAALFGRLINLVF
jgi:hypothetical protein